MMKSEDIAASKAVEETHEGSSPSIPTKKVICKYFPNGKDDYGAPFYQIMYRSKTDPSKRTVIYVHYDPTLSWMYRPFNLDLPMALLYISYCPNGTSWGYRRLTLPNSSYIKGIQYVFDVVLLNEDNLDSLGFVKF